MGMEVVKNVSSGQTTELSAQQSDFIRFLVEDCDHGIVFADATAQSWTFDYAFVNQEECVHFFQTVGKIIPTVSANRYILKYLLDRYGLFLDEKKLKQLGDFVEHKTWRITPINSPEELREMMTSLRTQFSSLEADGSCELSKQDFKKILNALCSTLSEEYSFQPDGNRFSSYFHRLLRDFNLARLREIALALDWDYHLYQGFRVKAIRHRAFNFLDRDEVSMYIALNYAGECGLTAYEAYQALNRIYPYSNRPPILPVPELENVDRRERNRELREAWREDPGNSSANLMDKLFSNLENRLPDTWSDEYDAFLKPELTEILFTEPIQFLGEIYDEIYRLNQEHPKRSWQDAFLKKWDEFSAKVCTDVLDEGGIFREVEEKPFGRHFMFRYLYGENVETQIRGERYPDEAASNRIADIRDSDMVSLAPDGVEDYFLDSQEFLSTRIRDRDFSQNALEAEEQQRNLLLTITFLNYAFDIDPETASYEERVADFEYLVIETMQDCGLMSLHSGYAYDAFLKLLLSCTNPLDLFQYIWFRKTGSETDFG